MVCVSLKVSTQILSRQGWTEGWDPRAGFSFHLRADYMVVGSALHPVLHMHILHSCIRELVSSGAVCIIYTYNYLNIALDPTWI